MQLVTRFEDSNGSKLRSGTLSEDMINILERAVVEVRPLLVSRVPFLLYGSHQNRAQGFFVPPESKTLGYFFSNIVQASQVVATDSAVNELLKRVNEAFGSNFNGVLVNEYEHGDDYISPHSDDDVDPSDGVVGISWGSARSLNFFHRPEATGAIAFKGGKFALHSSHGTIYHMTGEKFQSSYKHGVPPVGKKLEPLGPRVSFTFRVHAGVGEEEKMRNATATMARVRERIFQEEIQKAEMEAAGKRTRDDGDVAFELPSAKKVTSPYFATDSI